LCRVLKKIKIDFHKQRDFKIVEKPTEIELVVKLVQKSEDLELDTGVNILSVKI